MSEQKHTPEPWKVFSKNGVVEIWNSAGNAIIGWTGFDSTRVKEKAKDNARRIVACVNACAGISTDNLEDNLPVRELARRYNVAVRHRDELRVALELAMDHIDMDALEISHCKDAAAIRAAIEKKGRAA